MILVTGATGFVGSQVVHALRARGHAVRALVRPDSSTRQLDAWGCELARGDVTDAASLRAAADGCEAVVHLVSIIAGRPAAFERVMVGGTANVVAAAEAAGPRRIVLMSALGVDESSCELVPYYRAKWAMEQAVAASRVEHVILRPGFVFGPGGGVLPLFVRQVRLSPVTPVVGDGSRRLQPIWVDDLAEATAAAADLPAVAGRTLELGGPDVVTWNELYARIAAALGKERRQLHLPVGLVRAVATVAERLPQPPVTRDQLTMLEHADNVCDPTVANDVLGLAPIGLDEMLRRAIAR
ncbi:MAG: NAD(P)H-binding protein [Thermoleophilia bacterium]